MRAPISRSFSGWKKDRPMPPSCDFDPKLMLNASLIAKNTPEKLVITASDGVCAALAERFGYIAINALSGKIDIRRVSASCWQIKGVFSAEIIQSCVVSGDPVNEKFQFELLERYLETFEKVEEIDPMGVDVELLENGMIPVGEAISQALAINATAWPRHPDTPILAPSPELKEQNHPFAKLSELKK